MLRLIMLSFLIIINSIPLFAQKEVTDEYLLKKLDIMIEHRDVYQQKMEQDISALRKALSYALDDNTKFAILGELFNKYRSFRVDTALIVAQERLELAKSMNNIDDINQGLMNLADVMNKMGKHEHALKILDKVVRTKTTEKDTYFYYIYYLSCFNDEIDTKRKQMFREKMQAYNDTLVSISEINTTSYITNKCGSLAMRGKWGEAAQTLSNYYNQMNIDNPDRARIEYQLAELYFGKQDTIQARHYLILASITDIQNAKKVYMSLQQLAILLFQEGDVARAYDYISCSLEDVNFGKARYRFIDIAKFLPIIKAGNDELLKAEKKRTSFSFILLSILIISLIIAFIILHNKNLKLLKIKQSLATQNLQLQEMTDDLMAMNKQVNESNHIKEEYIGLLFNICSDYIYKLENNQKNLLKIVNTGSMSDVSKMIRDQPSASEGFKLFISKFDAIFLSIFPDFVDTINESLSQEERIILKDGELLTPELRIYALIKLGITDNAKIAVFLHYSLQTVYNYRMKMRNKALIPGKEPIA